MQSPIAAVLLPLSLVTGLVAQTVHVVGPGGFATIQGAVDAAAPGDVVHVQPGTYFSFTVTKELRLRALGAVTLGTSLLQPGTVVVQAPGASVDFVGFNMMNLSVTGGRVSLEGCVVRQGTAVHNARLHLEASTIMGPGALLATRSDVTAVQCTFGDPTPSFLVSGPLLDLVGSRFHASFCSASGGFMQGVQLLFRATSGSQAWISDSHFGPAAPGHCPMLVSPDSQLRFDRTTYSAAAGCQLPTVGPLLGVQRSAPLLVGQPFALSFKTAPGAFVALVASTGLGATDFAPLLEQPAWLDHPNSFLVAVLLADGTGNASASVPIPGGPGIADLTLWFEGVGGPGQPLQASPPIGGVAR